MSTKKKTGFDVFVEDYFAVAKPGTKYGVLFLLIGILGVIFYYFVYMPIGSEVARLNKESSTTKEEIRQATNTASALVEKKKKLNDRKEEFSTLVTAFSDEDQLPYLLATISEIGHSHGLTFQDFKPEKEVKVYKPEEEEKKPDPNKRKQRRNLTDADLDFYNKTPLSIKIRGSYYSIIMFLDQISKLERIVTMHDINMDNPQLEGEEVVLNANCQLIMYKYMGEKKK